MDLSFFPVTESSLYKKRGGVSGKRLTSAYSAFMGECLRT